jgi:hypothetical protein
MENLKYIRSYMMNFLENLMTYYQNKMSYVNDQVFVCNLSAYLIDFKNELLGTKI